MAVTENEEMIGKFLTAATNIVWGGEILGIDIHPPTKRETDAKWVIWLNDMGRNDDSFNVISFGKAVTQLKQKLSSGADDEVVVKLGLKVNKWNRSSVSVCDRIH